MPDRLQTLEEKIRGVLDAYDRLETENRSIRALVDQEGSQISEREIVGQVESLKLEKEKLERKLQLVDQALARVVQQLEKLEI